MLSLFDKDKVQKALMFASNKHKDQMMGRSSGNLMPYATHFFGVALNAINFCFNEDVNKTLILQLAFLHDTLEDTNTTYENLTCEFGKIVADGVLALTRNPEIEPNLQIEDCLKRIKTQPKEVAIVKMADRLFNIRERFSGWDKQKQDNYKQEAQLICNELGCYSANLKQALQQAIDVY